MLLLLLYVMWYICFTDSDSASKVPEPGTENSEAVCEIKLFVMNVLHQNL